MIEKASYTCGSESNSVSETHTLILKHKCDGRGKCFAQSCDKFWSTSLKCESGDEVIMDHKSIEIILENQYEDNLKMPGLMKKLTGLSEEDSKNFKLDLPEDFFNEKFKKTTAAFNVKIISIKEKNLPEVDDNFAKLMDPSINDLKELKKQIKKKDRKSTRLNSSHSQQSRMPSSA